MEQIVIISDGVENSPPYFHDVLENYERTHHYRPRVVFIKIGNETTKYLERTVAGMEVIPFRGDYYSLPNIVPLLCSGTRHQMLTEVLSMPLYTRADADSLSPRFDATTFEIL